MLELVLVLLLILGSGLTLSIKVVESLRADLSASRAKRATCAERGDAAGFFSRRTTE